MINFNLESKKNFFLFIITYCFYRKQFNPLENKIYSFYFEMKIVLLVKININLNSIREGKIYKTLFIYIRYLNSLNIPSTQ